MKVVNNHLLKTANKVGQICAGCGLQFHDPDAQFCKVCGTKLKLNNLHKNVESD